MSTATRITNKQLAEAPERFWDQTSVHWAVLIKPQRRLHNSGYPVYSVWGMDYGNGEIKLTLFSSCSDAIHVNTNALTGAHTSDLNFDAIAPCGATRIFARGRSLRVGAALSSLFIEVLSP